MVLLKHVAEDGRVTIELNHRISKAGSPASHTFSEAHTPEKGDQYPVWTDNIYTADYCASTYVALWSWKLGQE